MKPSVEATLKSSLPSHWHMEGRGSSLQMFRKLVHEPTMRAHLLQGADASTQPVLKHLRGDPAIDIKV